VTEQLALQQPGGNRGTIEFHEGPFPSIAEIVQGPRDQLLPAARFTEYQHGRTGGRDGLNLFEHLLQGATVADDLLEVVRGLNFFLEIDLFFGELILERGNLPERERVLHRNRNLLRDLGQELHVLLAEASLTAPTDVQGSEGAIVRQER